jgi:hypothetical protein
MAMRCRSEVHVDNSELDDEHECLRRLAATHGNSTGAYSTYLPMEMIFAIWILPVVCRFVRAPVPRTHVSVALNRTAMAITSPNAL